MRWGAGGWARTLALAWLALVSFAPLSKVTAAPAVVASVAVAASAPKPEPVALLWIGNSYTFFNDLPGLVGQLLADAGCAYRQEQYLHGGRTLLDHWRNEAGAPGLHPGKDEAALVARRRGRVAAWLREPIWNGVVLQGQSREAFVENGRGGPEEFIAAAKQWADFVRATHPRARLFFYETWARQATPEDQPTITKLYAAAAAAVRGEVVPVGTAWAQVRRERPDLVLHLKDGSHPTPLGSYLAALVFYAVLTGRDPQGLPSALAFPDTSEGSRGKPVQIRIDAPTAHYLQGVARVVTRAP